MMNYSQRSKITSLVNEIASLLESENCSGQVTVVAISDGIDLEYYTNRMVPQPGLEWESSSC